ncbi:hypothetical protein, partial [Nocardia sp. NPDC004415]
AGDRPTSTKPAIITGFPLEPDNPLSGLAGEPHFRMVGLYVLVTMMLCGPFGVIFVGWVRQPVGEQSGRHCSSVRK